MRRLTIDGLAFGGDAVGRDETGKVCFVPRACPGDELLVEIVEERKDFARGRVTKLVRPGAARVEAPCVHFVRDGCGGCQWQHVNRETQVAAKAEVVARAVRRLGVTPEPVRTPAPAYGWRRRVRVSWRDGAVGFHAWRSDAIVDVKACPQLEPRLEQAVLALKEKASPTGEGETELIVGVGGDVHSGTGAAIELEEGPFWGRADVFAQASAAGNRAMRELVAELVGASGARVLELYAGSGNFTRDMAGAARVVAAESHEAAVSLGKRNAPGAEWRVEPVETTLRWAKSSEWDVVLVDPPRAGVGREPTAALAALGASRVVYVSCDPATFARDAEVLVAAGYRARRVVPFDLMPQTYHVEVVGLFERAGTD